MLTFCEDSRLGFATSSEPQKKPLFLTKENTVKLITPVAAEPNASFETKYIVNQGAAPIVHSVLEAVTQSDPAYPIGRISSAYFDSPGLHLLQEKVDSDYIKFKVRLRWYDSSANELPAYLECKKKIGTQRFKDRVDLLIPKSAVRESQEDYALLQQLSMATTLDIYDTKKYPIFPMIIVRYNRARFLDAASGSRISLDSNIRFSSVNSQFFPDLGGRRSNTCVLEIKNGTGDFPASLGRLRPILSPREAYSKYEECWNLYSDTTYRRSYTTITS